MRTRTRTTRGYENKTDSEMVAVVGGPRQPKKETKFKKEKTKIMKEEKEEK